MKNAGKREQNDACINFAEQERFRRSQNKTDVINRWLLPIQVAAQDRH